MIAAPFPRGGGAAEAGGFLALALLLHLAAFALFGGPSGLVSGGAGGDAEATISGAAPALSALVEIWSEAPEAAAPAPRAPAPTHDAAPETSAPLPEAVMLAPLRASPAPAAAAAPVAPPPPVSPGLAPAPEPPAPEPPALPEAAAPAAPRDIAPARAPTPPPRAEAPARAAPPPPAAAAEAEAPPPQAARATAAPAREAPAPGPGPAEEAAPSARAEGSGGGAEAGPGDAPESVGDAAARASLAERWGGAIRRAVEREKRAPALIRRAGVVEISLMVDRSGALLSASVAKSAGAPALDEAALAAVRAAAPYPAAPGALGQGPFGFTLPVVFRP